MNSVLKYNQYFFDSIYSFVKEWQYQDEFKTLTHQSVENYNGKESDTDLISKLLNKYDKLNKYIVWYDDKRDGIWVFQLKLKK